MTTNTTPAPGSLWRHKIDGGIVTIKDVNRPCPGICHFATAGQVGLGSAPIADFLIFFEPHNSIESLGVACSQGECKLYYHLPNGVVFAVPTKDVDVALLRACLDDAERRSKGIVDA